MVQPAFRVLIPWTAWACLTPASPALAQSAAPDDPAACSAEKMAYATKIGVPCSSLGAPVDFAPRAAGAPVGISARPAAPLPPAPPPPSATATRAQDATAARPALDPTQRQAEIYIYRPQAWQLWNATFFLDDSKLVELFSAIHCAYTVARFPSGVHTLKQQWPIVVTPFNRTINLTVKWSPGRRYYYRLDYGPKILKEQSGLAGGYIVTTLAQIDPEIAEHEIAKCSYAPPMIGGFGPGP
jgi:hypothetical protein